MDSGRAAFAEEKKENGKRNKWHARGLRYFGREVELGVLGQCMAGMD